MCLGWGKGVIAWGALVGRDWNTWLGGSGDRGLTFARKILVRRATSHLRRKIYWTCSGPMYTT